MCDCAHAWAHAWARVLHWMWRSDDNVGVVSYLVGPGAKTQATWSSFPSEPSHWPQIFKINDFVRFGQELTNKNYVSMVMISSLLRLLLLPECWD